MTISNTYQHFQQIEMCSKELVEVAERCFLPNQVLFSPVLKESHCPSHQSAQAALCQNSVHLPGHCCPLLQQHSLKLKCEHV